MPEDVEKLTQIILLGSEVGAEFGKNKLKMNPNQQPKKADDASQYSLSNADITYEPFMGRLGRVWMRRRFKGPVAHYR